MSQNLLPAFLLLDIYIHEEVPQNKSDQNTGKTQYFSGEANRSLTTRRDLLSQRDGYQSTPVSLSPGLIQVPDLLDLVPDLSGVNTGC